jgi:hypothetical protein
VVAAAATATCALSLIAAGCGGGSGGAGVASVGTTRAATAAASTTSASASPLLTQLLHLAACMRSHGVTNFPDPTTQGGGLRLVIGPKSGIDPSSPLFQHAQKACASLMPTRNQIAAEAAKELQQRLPGLISFAKCMRHRGVAHFPDPSPQQGLTLEMVAAAGVDIRSPSVFADAQACLPVADGAITAAQLRQVEAQATTPGQNSP